MDQNYGVHRIWHEWVKNIGQQNFVSGGQWAVCSMFYDDMSTQWESRIHSTTLKKWVFPKSGIVASVRPLTACISLSRDVWFGHLLVWEMRPLKMQLHATAQLTPNTQIHRYTNTNTQIHYLATCLFEICDCSRHKWTPVNIALWNILCALFNNVQCLACNVHCALCIV